MYLLRRLVGCHEDIRAGGWDVSRVFGAPRLRGKTVGVVGCGRIGTAFVRRAQAFGLRVVVCDPYRPDGLDKMLGVERAATLEELLPQCHFVSLHCPLTAETRHLLNDRSLALLPRGAYVVNTARGPCVDAAALLRALETGHIAAAALDVLEREPLDDEALRRHPRVLLTPHTAFYSVEGFAEMRTKGAQECLRLVTGVAVRNIVNLAQVTAPRFVLPPTGA